jgi:hypothetical protein
MRFALLESKLAIVKALNLVEIQKCEKTEVYYDDLIVVDRPFIYCLDSNSIGSNDNVIC